MVLAEQLYHETRIATGDLSKDINLTQQEFVLLYNKEAQSWLKEKINLTKKDDRINDIQYWFVSDSGLRISHKTTNTVEYELPSDFMDFVSSTSLVQQDECKKNIINYITKPFNKDLLFQDILEKPSFEWEEGLCYLTDKKLVVYYTDFELVNTYISYYKQIKNISLEGYTNFDGSPSRLENPDYSKSIADEICNRVVNEFNRMYRNGGAFQLSQQKVSENRALL